jgi:uncharacterized protein YjbJ (UPF0337 family)
MADTIGTTDQGAEESGAFTKNLADQALSAGQEFTEKAKDLAGSSADALKGHVADAKNAAKEVAFQATDKLKDAVNDRKSSGAEYVGSLADKMRRAAHEFDADLPIAGTYIRKAAAQVDGVSEGIRKGNLNDLVQSAQSFARRQPSAFLGIAVLAGFGAVRFLKSSAENSQSVGSSVAHRSGQGYRDDYTK